MRCCRFFKRAASFEQPVDLIVQRFRAGAAGKRSPEQRVLYQLVEQQIDDPDVLGIYTSGKQQITGAAQVQFWRLQPRQKHTDSRKLLSALILT